MFYLRTAVAGLVAYQTFMFVFVSKLSTDTIFSDMLVTTLVFADNRRRDRCCEEA